MGQLIDLLYLTENLAFADDLGIEAGSDAQQVDDAVPPGIGIEIVRPDFWFTIQQGKKEILQHAGRRAFGSDGIDFTAVARREDDRFMYCLILPALRQGRADVLRLHRELFMYGNGDRLVIKAPDE